MIKATETQGKPSNKVEAYVLNQEERKRRNKLRLQTSEAWYDLGSYYQLSSLGNVRKRNGLALTPTLRNGESYYLIDGEYFTRQELIELLPD